MQHDTKLQQLELASADEETLEDIRHSDALTTTTTVIGTSYFRSARLIGSMGGLSLAVVSSYWTFACPAAVLLAINEDIGPSANASLFSVIWSISTGIGNLLFGRLSDKFGRRWFVVGATGLSVVGGIIACRAQTMNTLIGANVILGLTAGVHSSYVLIAGEICPNKYKFVGVVATIVPTCLPTGFGAYLAARLVHYYSWRYIYYIFLPMQSLATIILFIFYRPPGFRQLHGYERSRMQEFMRIDFLGVFLFVAGLLLFLLGISWGGQPLPWTSPRILGLIISGACTIILFVLWEIYGNSPSPLILMSLFRDTRGFVCLVVLGGISSIGYLALSIIWPSQVNLIFASPTTSWSKIGWLTTTNAFGAWAGYAFLGPWMGVIKHVRTQLIVLMAIQTAFVGAMATCDAAHLGRSAAFTFIASFPSGILEIASALLAQMDCNDADLGMITSIIYMTRTATGSILTAVFLAIQTSKLPTGINKYVPQAAVQAGLEKSSIPDLLAALAVGTPQALAKVPGMTAETEAAVSHALSSAYAYAYQFVYYAAAAFCSVGLIACLGLRDHDHLFNNHLPRQIYKADAAVPKQLDEKNLSTGDIKDLEESRTEEVSL